MLSGRGRGGTDEKHHLVRAAPEQTETPTFGDRDRGRRDDRLRSNVLAEKHRRIVAQVIVPALMNCSDLAVCELPRHFFGLAVEANRYSRLVDRRGDTHLVPPKASYMNPLRMTDSRRTTSTAGEPGSDMRAEGRAPRRCRGGRANPQLPPLFNAIGPVPQHGNFSNSRKCVACANLGVGR